MDLSHPPLSALPAPAAAGNEIDRRIRATGPRDRKPFRRFGTARRRRLGNQSAGVAGQAVRARVARARIRRASRTLHRVHARRAGATRRHVEPPARDRRFEDDAWLHWPYNVLHQSLATRLARKALGHATTVHPLLPNFDCLGWWRGALASRREWKGRSIRRSETSPGARYSWTLFRPTAKRSTCSPRECASGRSRCRSASARRLTTPRRRPRTSTQGGAAARCCCRTEAAQRRACCTTISEAACSERLQFSRSILAKAAR